MLMIMRLWVKHGGVWYSDLILIGGIWKLMILPLWVNHGSVCDYDLLFFGILVMESEPGLGIVLLKEEY